MALRRPLSVTRAPLPLAASTIGRKEWRWLATVAGFLLLLTLVPLVLAAQRTPSGTVFPGFVVIARDAYVYQALWHSGAAGDWLFRSRYTSEALPGILLYPWYLWSGHLLGGLPPAWLYHATRLLAGALLAVSVYTLAAELYRPITLRRWAFVMAALGGGVGLFLPSLGIGPLLFRATETLVPGSSVADLVSMAPHLPLALALMCAVFTIGLRLRGAFSLPLFGAGLMAVLGLQLIYPQLALLATLVLGAWSLLRLLRGPLLLASVGAVLQAPYLFYLVWLMRANPQALAAVRSALDIGDPVGFLLLSHATATVLIIVALLKRRLRGDLILPALWIVGMTVFMFVPGFSGSLSRSFMASSIPFALCSVPGLLVVLRGLRAYRWRRRLAGAILAISCLYGLVSLVQPLWIAGLRLDPLAEYEHVEEATLLSRLAPHVSSRDLVLTTYLDGLFVPAQTSARVYAGHPDMTIDVGHKASDAYNFFRLWSESQQHAFLKANGVDFVLTGDHGAVLRLEADPALRVMDRQGGWVLFQVNP